ncbi:hemolysin family protein [Paenibacillus sp. A3]|uniref:hemolysin family protein n=1 Tax=Paenibacillus sp. A3 TaxID=1337054 RepID=UPI000AC518FE
MVKVTYSRVESRVCPESRQVRSVRFLMQNVDAHLSACQLGITLTSLGLGWIGGPVVAALLKPVLRPLHLPEPVIGTLAFLIAFTLIAMLHTTLGEQVPKAYAIRKSEQVTRLSSVPLVGFYKAMRPVIRCLNGISTWLLRMTGIASSMEYRLAHTEDEIRGLMKESNRSGFIDNTELALVDNIFDFAETYAREIMIPRTEMVCLYAGRSYEDNKAIAISEMHTRYPVCDPDKDSIIGFVHMKDLLIAGEQPETIRSILRPIMKVPESMRISELLKLMQKKKTQMALLIDEYGGTSGLVTFEDIMEEIVGEIQDEFDEERPQMETRGDHLHSIDGRLLIEEVNSYFGLGIASDDYDTIGGWMYSQVEMPPKKQQSVVWENRFRFMIEEIDHLRITRILVVRQEQTDGSSCEDRG